MFRVYERMSNTVSNEGCYYDALLYEANPVSPKHSYTPLNMFY